MQDRIKLQLNKQAKYHMKTSQKDQYEKEIKKTIRTIEESSNKIIFCENT